MPIEVKLTMRPQPRCSMPGITPRQSQKTERRLVLMIRSNVVSSSPARSTRWRIAAQLTRMSTPPQRSVASATTRSHSAVLERSATSSCAPPLSRPPASARRCASMSTIETRTPRSTINSATAKPRPPAAPVTMAAFELELLIDVGRKALGLRMADIAVEALRDLARVLVDVPRALRVLRLRVGRRLDDANRVAVLLDRLLLHHDAAVRAVEADALLVPG